jgi:hypothetical protein
MSLDDTLPVALFEVEDALVLADDLLNELGRVPGQADAANEILTRWADVLAPAHFAQVCIAALTVTFTECLREVPRDEWPANPVRFQRSEDPTHE